MQLGGERNYALLVALGAAYAEAGRYTEAATTAERALNLAKAQGNTALAGTLQEQLKCYREGAPYHGMGASGR